MVILVTPLFSAPTGLVETLGRSGRQSQANFPPIPPQGPTIKVVSANGGELRTVPTGFSGFVTQLAWSPDGQTFAFTGVTGGDEEIWLMSDFLPLVKPTARH